MTPFFLNYFFARETFKDTEIDSDDVVRSTIFILSKLIARHEFGRPHHSSEKDQQLELWTSLSSILTTESSRTVAATGVVLVPEQHLLLEISLVVEDGRPCVRESGAVLTGVQGGGPSVEHLDPQSEGEVEGLLMNLKSADSIEDHARDVCTIFNYFLRRPDVEENWGTYGALLVDFTIYRTRRLLSARLRCGREYWSDNPIRIIHAAWNRSGENVGFETLADPLNDWHEDTSICVRNQHLVGVLKDAGISPSKSTTDLTEFPLTKSNGKQWARVLLDALERLEKQVDLLKDVAPGDSEESRWAELRRNVLTVRGALHVIHQFVRLGVVSKLVTYNVAAQLRAKYKAAKQKINPQLEQFQADLDDEAVTAQICRYITSLAIPYSAPEYLMNWVRKYSKVNAQLSMKQLLIVGDSPTIDGVLVEKLKTELAYLSPEKTERIDELFKRPDRKEVAVSIHAEAAVMGAAYSDVKDEDFKRSKVHIGVSRKWCFCCGLLGSELNDWRLRSELNDWRRWGDGHRSNDPEVVLQGCHGTVLPWVPPLGVPSKVLKNIRVELLKRLWDLIHKGMPEDCLDSFPFTTSELESLLKKYEEPSP
ncbi:hypothetical protein C8Q74DRAFT_1216806 [Fomes fomentarius]|nr:hypothetical protein C8Q74DRAFT_1216806 [Fomes fomentarius]